MRKRLSVTFIAIIITILSITTVVFAISYAPQKVFNRDTWYGYFIGSNYDQKGDPVLPALSSSNNVPGCNLAIGNNKRIKGDGNAIPACIDTPEELIAFLQTYNSYATGQNRTGAAFIVCTMLGLGADACVSSGYMDGVAANQRSISSNGWAEIGRRLANSNVDYDWTSDITISRGTINSYYQDDKNDDAFFANGEARNPSTGSETHNGIQIFSEGTKTVQYRLFRSCANPIGSIMKVPPAPQNWNLTPYVSLNPTNYIEAGAAFNITSYINNTGEVTSGDVTYNLEKKVGSGAYSTFSPHSGTRTFPLGDTYVTNNLSFSDTDYDAGTQICFRLSVTPRSNTNAATLTSAEDCIIIGKKPKVQVWGGNLWVRGKIQTSSSIKNGAMYGSWDEYALFAGGNIIKMASGSAIATGLASPAYDNPCNYSKLTFANTSSSVPNSCSNDTANKGYYDTASRLIPDVAASFPTTNSNPTITTGSITAAGHLGNLASGVYTNSGNGVININSLATLPSGKWIVINTPSNDVNINANINYANGPYNAISEIPQLIIIAKNITINSSVTNVDAWLIAHNGASNDGSIKTCEIIGKTVAQCNQALTINGPVMTDKLYLYRTAGSGTGANSGDPAEIINLRSDAYLWAYSRTLGRGRVRTVHTRELPPRF